MFLTFDRPIVEIRDGIVFRRRLQDFGDEILQLVGRQVVDSQLFRDLDLLRPGVDITDKA